MHFSKLSQRQTYIYVERETVEQVMLLIAFHYFQKNNRIEDNFSTTFLKYYDPLKTMNYYRESTCISNQRLKFQKKTLYFNSAIMFKLYFTDIKKELSKNGILDYFHHFHNKTANCNHPPTII